MTIGKDTTRCSSINGNGSPCQQVAEFGDFCRYHHRIEEQIEPWEYHAVKAARAVANRRGERLVDAFGKGRKGEIARNLAWTELEKRGVDPVLREAIERAFWTP